jgi:4-amino-4-deoxy-L-arabinose transferase-like glycosyltransferase
VRNLVARDNQVSVRNKWGEWIRPLGLVFLVTCVVRGYLFFATPVIAKDGVYYIGKAQLIAQGAWRPALADNLEPLFPVSILFFHHLVPDWEVAGKLASISWGILSVVPLFLLVQLAFGSPIAFWSGLFYSLHPYFAWNSADVLAEPPYLFFFLLSLWLAVIALKYCSMGWYLLCAGAIVLARLTRTEGIWVSAVVLVFYGIRCLRSSHVRIWSRLDPLVRFSVAFGMALLPLIAYGEDLAGTSELWAYKGLGWGVYVFDWLWTATQEHVGEWGDAAEVTRLGGLVWHYYVYKFIAAFHPMLLVLGMYAVSRKDLREKHREYFFLTASVWVIYLSGVFFAGFIRGIEETSRRFMMAPIAVALPWAAVGFGGAVARLQASRAGRLLHCTPETLEKWKTGVLGIATLVLAVTTIKPHRTDKLPIKDAAAWIIAQG